MSTVSSAASNIFDTIPDGPNTFPFFNLLIDSLIMSLSIEQGTQLTISA